MSKSVQKQPVISLGEKNNIEMCLGWPKQSGLREAGTWGTNIWRIEIVILVPEFIVWEFLAGYSLLTLEKVGEEFGSYLMEQLWDFSTSEETCTCYIAHFFVDFTEAIVYLIFTE